MVLPSAWLRGWRVLRKMSPLRRDLTAIGLVIPSIAIPIGLVDSLVNPDWLADGGPAVFLLLPLALLPALLSLMIAVLFEDRGS